MSKDYNRQTYSNWIRPNLSFQVVRPGKLEEYKTRTQNGNSNVLAIKPEQQKKKEKLSLGRGAYIDCIFVS